MTVSMYLVQWNYISEYQVLLQLYLFSVNNQGYLSGKCSLNRIILVFKSLHIPAIPHCRPIQVALFCFLFLKSFQKYNAMDWQGPPICNVLQHFTITCLLFPWQFLNIRGRNCPSLWYHMDSYWWGRWCSRFVHPYHVVILNTLCKQILMIYY